MRKGVFGGTFDPIHVGHLVIAEAAAETFSLDRVLFVPCAHPPHKPVEGLAPVADRLEMVRLAVEGNPRFSVCDLEAIRGGVSYTVDTLEALRREDPDAELFLILGADMAATMPTWRSIEQVRQLARPCVASREGYEGASEGYFRIPTIGVSSSDLRARIGAGRSIRYLVPDPVRRYMEDRGLYRT